MNVYFRMYTCIYLCVNVRDSTHVYVCLRIVYVYLRICTCTCFLYLRMHMICILLLGADVDVDVVCPHCMYRCVVVVVVCVLAG